MSGKLIVSIVPHLPPAMCGTSTYGWTLAQQWPDRSQEFVHLVGDGAEASRKFLGTEGIAEMEASAATVIRRLGESPGAGVIVHYASRGYHRYGCPWWLGKALARWRRKNPAARMLVFFHEVPRELPFTSRHYVLERINRSIINRIARAANVVLTNTREHAQRLEEFTGLREVNWLPVPSNIPPPGIVDGSFARRDRKSFAIFGLPFTHWLTVRCFQDELAAWHRAGVLSRLHLIGPTDQKHTPATLQCLCGILPAEAIVEHGGLEPAAISTILGEVGFCLSQGSAGNFSKSGTFTAFAAHGCAVIARMETEIGKVPLCHLVRPEELLNDREPPDIADFERRSRALHDWYVKEADWSVIAGKIHRLFTAGEAFDSTSTPAETRL